MGQLFSWKKSPYSIIIITLIITQHVLALTQPIKDTYMFEKPLCDLPERVTKGCAKLHTNVRGFLHCCMMCNIDHTCVGASMEHNQDCHLHKICPDVTNSCLRPSPNLQYVVKKCGNRGTWMKTEDRCQCRNGMIGTTCDQYPNTCTDLITHGYEKGIHDAYLDPEGDGIDVFWVKCDINFHDAVFIFIFSNTGNGDFDRKWKEYRNGFEIDEKNFWIGLENIHRLTKSRQHTVTLYIRFGVTLEIFRRHNNFTLSDQADGYRVSFPSSFLFPVDGYGASTLRCLDVIQRIPFSTWDRDMDITWDDNCAKEAGSAYWFSDCNARCNIFGRYPSNGYPRKQQIYVPGVSDETYVTLADKWDSIGMFIVETREP